jgi:hypothetical protein
MKNIAIVIESGRFYTDGQPIVITKDVASAKTWLKANGFKRNKDVWQNDLFEKEDDDGVWFWAKFEEIDWFEGDIK